MRFLKDDYIRTRQRRNRTLAILAVIVIVVVVISLGMFKKTGEKGIVDDNGGGKPPIDTEDKEPPVTAAQTPGDLPALIEKTRKSVAVIKIFDKEDKLIGQGSGFFIGAAGQEGSLVSNRHVFRSARRVEVESSRGKHPFTGVISQSSEYDLVRLAVDTRVHPIVPLEISEKLPRVGEKVVVIGSPLGLEATVSDGIVSAVRDLDPIGQVIQITCPISPGSSGSPVINMKGEVIGVATFQLREGQNLNFAIPIARLKKLKPVEGKALANIIYDISGLDESMSNFEKGEVLYDRKEYEGAIGFLRKAVEEDPQNAAAYYHLGICYRETRQIDAIEAFKAAIKINPDYFEAYCQLGATYNQLNMQTEAITVLREALRINPNHDEALLNLGIAYTLNKKYDLAVSVLEKSLEIYPSAKAYYFLGVSYGEMTRFGKAIQALRNCVEMDPKYIEAYIALATAYAAEENWVRGIEALNKAVEIEPANPQVHFLLGALHLGNHDLESALLEYELLKKLKDSTKLQDELKRAITRYQNTYRQRY
jgi:serine protease Do